MNNVTTKTEAGREPGGGAGPLARLVRHGVVACMLACTAAGAMAQDRNGPPMRERYDNRVQESRFDQRAYEEARRNDQAMRDEARARQEQMRDSVRDGMRDEGGRRGRMTPDERLELKRQINEAGRDLYPNARRR